MAMMKSRKLKRYAEGGAIYPDKSLTSYVPPSAGYVPGASAEHMYFQPAAASANTSNANAASAANAAEQAAASQALYNAYDSGGGAGGGGAGGPGAGGDGPGGGGAGAAAGDAGGSASAGGPDGGAGDGAGTWAKGGAIKVKKMAKVSIRPEDIRDALAKHVAAYKPGAAVKDEIGKNFGSN